jgi:hypothetical protein
LNFGCRAVDLERGADVGQQGHKAGALDGLGDHALVHRVGARALAGQELAVAAYELAQRLGVLVVDEQLSGRRRLCRLDLRAVERLELFLILSALAATALPGSGHLVTPNRYSWIIPRFSIPGGEL